MYLEWFTKFTFFTLWNNLIHSIMSSNIKVTRICKHCGNEFTAKTTTTKYCSKKCNSAVYKARERVQKVDASNKETQQIKAQPMEELKAKEFLTVTQVSILIGCSRQNVYKLINTGKLKATNILEKKTIIKRSDIDNLFNEKTSQRNEEIPIQQKQEINDWISAGNYSIADCYTLTEVQSKYGIAEKTLYDLIIRNNIPKIKKGWYAYVPKIEIDNLLS